MNKFIEFENEILIPIQIVETTFYEKEENSLNQFQFFILEAIESGHNINQITEATSLTRNVIEAEIVQMIGQKLLIKDADTILLSALSKKLLMVSRCVNELNKEKKHFFINLMTCEIENFENEELFNCENESYLRFKPKISEKDIDGISMEDNITFFADYMNSFADMNQTDIETVLTSVFVIFKTIDKTKYIKKTIHRLPCLIGEKSPQNYDHEQKQNSITVKGIIYELKYQVESQTVNSNHSILSELIRINEKNSELLSDKGHHILKLHEQLTNYNNMSLTCFYDTTSGQYEFVLPEDSPHKGMRPHLNLPLLNNISDKFRENIIIQLREHYGISNEFDIKEVSCEEKSYKIECELVDLWRNDYE